jgi:hypothetical protein
MAMTSDRCWVDHILGLLALVRATGVPNGKLSCRRRICLFALRYQGHNGVFAIAAMNAISDAALAIAPVLTKAQSAASCD